MYKLINDSCSSLLLVWKPSDRSDNHAEHSATMTAGRGSLKLEWTITRDPDNFEIQSMMFQIFSEEKDLVMHTEFRSHKWILDVYSVEQLNDYFQEATLCHKSPLGISVIDTEEMNLHDCIQNVLIVTSSVLA